jgi:DNA-binding CsgD family transcriptional regulator
MPLDRSRGSPDSSAMDDAPMPSMTREAWPLVGRTAELDLVERTLFEPRSGGVVVAGVAGVGKTRLAAEAVARAEASGWRIARVRATRSGRDIPFGAMSGLLPDVLEPATGFLNLIAAAARAIGAAAEGERLVLSVDDAQYLDGHSATLIHHLATTRIASLVVTVRTDEPAPETVVALWKDGLVERVELEPLSRDAVKALLSTVLKGQIDGASLHRFWESTRGNPLYLRELVLDGLASGALARRRDVWQWAGPVHISSWIGGLIDQRLEGVGTEERAVLEIVAEAEIVDRSPPLGSDDVLGALERRGLIEEFTEGHRRRIRLSHPLYAEAVKASTPPARRREILRQLADTLEATAMRRRGDLLRVTTWREASGSPSRPELLVLAARQAVAIIEPALGERLARSAIDVGGGFDARMVLVEALMGQGRSQDAEDELALLATQADDDMRLLMVASTRAQNLYWTLNRRDEAISVLVDAERRTKDDGLRAIGAGGRAYMLFYEGALAEATEVAEEILRAPTAPPRAVALAMTVACQAAWLRGEPARTLFLLGTRLKEVEEGSQGLTWASFGAAGPRMFAAACLGDLAQILETMNGLDQQALSHGADWLHGYAAFGRGWVALLQGKVETAIREFRESAALIAENDPGSQGPLTQAGLAEGLALRGDVKGASQAANEIGRWPGVWLLRVGPEARARAWTAAAAGETTRAIDILLTAAASARTFGAATLELWALHDAARLGAVHEVADRVDELSVQAEGPLAAAFAGHVAALAVGDARKLDEISRAFEQLTFNLHAAETAAEAATIYRRQGRHAAAYAARTRAAALAASCEGARTPALAAIETGPSLSRRELEVASLAARGLSNAEVAERLVLSVRTVENHLHNVFQKVDVGSRHELAAILLAPYEGIPASEGQRRAD